MKKAVLFDLDGTLLDTSEDIGLALGRTLGCSFSKKQVDSYIGNGLKNAIKAAMADTGTSADNLDSLYEKLIENYKDKPICFTHPYKGVPELLKTLTDAGIKVGVFSNKNQDILETVVGKCLPGICFSFIAGRNGRFKAKPDPQAVFSFCESAGCTIQDILYVGDSEVDYNCAKNAGCDVVLVPWGSRTRQSLLEKGVEPDVLAVGIDDILAASGLVNNARNN